MDRAKPDVHDDYERCDAMDSKHFPENTKGSRTQPLPEVSRNSALAWTTQAFETVSSVVTSVLGRRLIVRLLRLATYKLPQGVQTLGQYMVGGVLTRRETVFSWIGVAVMFFVVMIPTVNQTILAYFTTEVRTCC